MIFYICFLVCHFQSNCFFVLWHVCTLGGGQPRRNSSVTCTVIRSADVVENSNDDHELVTDALMGKAGESGSHASSTGATSGQRYINNDNGCGLKNELQTGYDVKIGDGMDIGIHGENGEYF